MATRATGPLNAPASESLRVATARRPGQRRGWPERTRRSGSILPSTIVVEGLTTLESAEAAVEVRPFRWRRRCVLVCTYLSTVRFGFPNHFEGERPGEVLACSGF
jgi:hypothetical protein